MTTYSAILEIEGHANGEVRDRRRYLQTLMDIRKSKIDDRDIIDILISDGNQGSLCKVKHFRYNYLCKDGCNHEPASYGIVRYFGIKLLIDSDLALGGIYKPNVYSELTLCGKTMPYAGVRLEMPKAPADIS